MQKILFGTMLMASIASASTIQLCDNVEDEILCKISQDYDSIYPPKPYPATIYPIVRIDEVTNVDENKQFISVLVKVIQEWYDPTLKVKNPQDEWYKIPKKDIDSLWRPIVYFSKAGAVQKISTLGKDNINDFWFKVSENKLWYSEDLEVTFTCEMDFSSFPIDRHFCYFTMGDMEMSLTKIKYNQSIVEHDFSMIDDMDNWIEINDSNTPFDFKVSLVRPFTKKSVGYVHPFSFTGMSIELERKSFGSLMETFYVPTAIFAIVSMISFLIKPSVVPGRMGMIVTMLLISSNVYNNIEAPNRRGFSYTEVWIIGSWVPILFSLFEYGVILFFSKSQHEAEKNIFETLDYLSLAATALFYAIFNAYYWTNV